MQDGVEEAVPAKTNPELLEEASVAAAAARPDLLSHVARMHLHGMGKGEKGEGVDGALLEAPEEAEDEALADAEAVEADEVVEDARLKDESRLLLHLDRMLWEVEGACLEVVERVVQQLQRRRLPCRRV